MTRPPVNMQGKAVVERGFGKELLIMLPNGDVLTATSPKDAHRQIADWYRREMNEDAINVGMIEWRHGLKPPKE